MTLVTRGIVGFLAAGAVTLSAPGAGAFGIQRIHHGPPRSRAPDAVTDVNYYGGHVISSVQVVTVLWTSAVDAKTQSQIGAFYSTIVKSSFIDWMIEYDTLGKNGKDGQPGSNQHIGRGSYVGSFTITPASTSQSLQDSDISTELVAQIQSGALPKPSVDAGGYVDTLYMIEFPPGYTITQSGAQSCQTFGAYHSSVALGGANVPYGVLPDCGSVETWDQKTQLHSHELAEAITDPEIGAATGTVQARPLAWMAGDTNGDEIGDLCESGGANAGSQIDTVVDGYSVQLEWSNYAGACVAGIPICDGSLAPPKCRPCSPYDAGNACSGATPACDTATGYCTAGPPPVGDGGTGDGGGSSGGSSGSGSGSSGGSSGGSASSGSGSGGSGGSGSGGNGSGGGVGANDAGAVARGDGGSGLDDAWGGHSSAGCRIGGEGGSDLTVAAGVLVAAAQLRRRRRSAPGAHTHRHETERKLSPGHAPDH